MHAYTNPIPDPELLARLRLIRTATIGPATFWALLERFGTATDAIRELPALMRTARSRRTMIIPSLAEAGRERDAACKWGARIIALGEPDYPALLAEIDAPPPLITVKGDPAIATRDPVAIVGARNSSALGQRMARDIASSLGEAGHAIASGLARGIDTAAHRGSLETGTIAVLAGGINIVYPPENRRLHDEIATTGLLVTEMPWGLEPIARHFPRRNRLISGLSLGVVVVEATLNSGSLITARLAGEHGREVFAIPGSPLDPRARGPNSLLRQGACLVEGAEDILSAIRGLPVRHQPPGHSQTPPPKADIDTLPLQQRIMSFLGPAPVPVDEIVRLLDASPASVAVAVLDLEIAGLLTRHPGQQISATPG